MEVGFRVIEDVVDHALDTIVSRFNIMNNGLEQGFVDQFLLRVTEQVAPVVVDRRNPRIGQPAQNDAVDTFQFPQCGVSDVFGFQDLGLGFLSLGDVLDKRRVLRFAIDHTHGNANFGGKHYPLFGQTEQVQAAVLNVDAADLRIPEVVYVCEVALTDVLGKQHIQILPDHFLCPVTPDLLACRIESDDYLFVIYGQDTVRRVLEYDVGLFGALVEFLQRFGDSRPASHEVCCQSQYQQRAECDQEIKQASCSRQRPISLVDIDFSGNAKAVVGAPVPGPDDRNAAVIVIALQVLARVPTDRAACHQRQWLFFALHRGSVPLEQVAAGVTNVNGENGYPHVRHQRQRLEVLAKPAFADHLARRIEGVTFAGFAHPSPLQDFGKLAFGINPQCENRDGTPGIIAHGKSADHGREVPSLTPERQTDQRPGIRLQGPFH